MSEKYDVIILGGGPAGLTAGIYLARARQKAIVIDTGTIGGQMIMSHTIANYPGLEEIPGYKISANMKKQAKQFGCKIVSNCDLTSIDITGSNKKVTVDDEDEYVAKAIIIASGGTPRTLGINAEEKFKGLGVSYCATCDGDFFTGKDIVVVGGGNTALEEAVSLTKYVRKVTLVHQFDNFQAYQYAIDEVKRHKQIDIIMESVLIDIIGDEGVEKVKIKSNRTGEIAEVPVSGVFIFIGYLPNSTFVKGVVDINERGEIICNEEMKTNVLGVFAAGDVRQKSYRQRTTAVSDGTVAALSAIDYLRSLEKEHMTIGKMQNIIDTHNAVMFYFSTKSCNVCKVLKPKIVSMVESEFSKMYFVYIDTEDHPDIAAQNLVFSVPTITVFFNGRESIRKARFMSKEELASEIRRPYNILFDE